MKQRSNELTRHKQEEKKHVATKVMQAHSKRAHVAGMGKVVPGTEVNELLPPDLPVIADFFNSIRNK